MVCLKIFTTSSQPSVSEKSAYDFKDFDLQLFNEEKTEEATPKRKEEAHSKGQVARSVEVNSIFVILAAFLALRVIGSYIYNELGDFMRLMLIGFSTHDFTVEFIQVLFIKLGIIFAKTALPVMVTILIVSVLINYLQVGFIFSLEPLLPQLDRINPLSGFKRLFSKRALVELVKSLLKISIISYFIYRFIIKETMQVPQLIAADLTDSLRTTASMTLDLVYQISGVMLIMAVLDYFYQMWEHKQSLKMSKQEIKQEVKQTEGNPQIKGKIREQQRALAMRRMMHEVPKADVVVTNPTHYAVALQYDSTMAAPMVVAKGQDFIAQRIKEIAKENRVVTVENKPLARALYGAVEVGETVPPELYQAVAEVLAYVYRLKKRLS
jgi:flagellar biosynthetic protein FlhB